MRRFKKAGMFMKGLGDKTQRWFDEVGDEAKKKARRAPRPAPLSTPAPGPAPAALRARAHRLIATPFGAPRGRAWQWEEMTSKEKDAALMCARRAALGGTALGLLGAASSI